MSTTGEKIREYRKRAGLTQAQVAQRMGIRQGTLTQYENGRRNPKYETLERIAEAIGCDVFDLVDYYDPRETELVEVIEEDDIDREINEHIGYLLLLEQHLSNPEIHEEKDLAFLQEKLRDLYHFLEHEKEMLHVKNYPLPPQARKNQLRNELKQVCHLNDIGVDKLLSYASDLAQIAAYTAQDSEKSRS